MERSEKKSVLSEAVAALISAIAGSGIGWLIWSATGNIGVGLGAAGPIAAIGNAFLRKVIK